MAKEMEMLLDRLKCRFSKGNFRLSYFIHL